MYKMCHVCGNELKMMGTGEEEVMMKKDNLFGLNERDSASTCKSCQEDGFTPFGTPRISPAISLNSSDSFISSCGELLADQSLQTRDDASGGALETAHDYLRSTLSSQAKSIDGLGTESLEYFVDKDIYNTAHSHGSSKLKDIPIMGIDDGPEGIEEGIDDHSQVFASLNEGATEFSHSFDIATDPNIWLPPEPEDVVDDVEGSVANNDNDEEFIDGTKWGQPILPYGYGFTLKREFRNAMSGVMNGRFKSVVSHLLRLEGISISNEDGENWVDIVTSLAWEAAMFVKPDATGGKTMDPEGYVKVKCISTGLCSQSQLVKGLVFKKHASHKHMPTKCKNPRLLLLRGTLGHSSSGLSSLRIIEQEKDDLHSVIEIIETSHPNVVLVEKTVSRDVLEWLASKAITLVFDMKLHHLERIARCTGSKIFSSADTFTSQKLKQCESFHFEKFLEEDGMCREGGKRVNKTLMFLEGCYRPLGCTVLLKGGPSDELKKIKFVVHCAVVVAYHLILDTSFFVDQRAMFSTICSRELNELQKDELPVLVSGCSVKTDVSCSKENFAEDSSFSLDIPIADGFREEPAFERTSCNSYLNSEENLALFESSPDIRSTGNEIDGSGPTHAQSLPAILPGLLLSSVSASLKKVFGDNFNLVFSASLQSFSTYFGYKESESDSQNTAVLPVDANFVASNCHETEAKVSTEEMKSDIGEQAYSASACCEVPPGSCKANANNDTQGHLMDDENTLSDVQSILFLVSSQSILRREICEQNHLCRIKYYKNFDLPLGQYLCDTLLNQRNQCTACGDPPENHVYNYVHQSGKLTVCVKQLSPESYLPGEAEGKLWMWAQCSKCEPSERNRKSTRRVVMSTVARGLSFGKFLELSFSVDFNSIMFSTCGHSLQWDYLRFYGLGCMVAMFRCSPVNIYTACMPPPVLDFKNLMRKYWIQKEAENVLKKGMILYAEVENLLQKIRSAFCSLWSNPSKNLTGFIKEFFKVKEMLKLEKSDFEVCIQNVIKNGHLGQAVHELLILNRVNLELALGSYVWDQRFQFLDKVINTCSTEKDLNEQEKDGRLEERGNASQYGERISDLEGKLDEKSVPENEISVKEIQISELSKGIVFGSEHEKREENSFTDVGKLSFDGLTASIVDGVLHGSFVDEDSCTACLHLSPSLPGHDKSCQKEHLVVSEPSQVEKTVPSIKNLLGCADSVADKSGCQPLRNSEDWVLTPLSELCREYRKDLQRDPSQKFEFINNYVPVYLSSASHLINDECNRIHIPIGLEDNVVSAYEGELTSMIACALALMHDEYSVEYLPEKDVRKEKEEDRKTMDLVSYPSSDVSVASPYWSSTDSLDSEGIRFKASAPSENSYTSTSDASSQIDSPSSVEDTHPEIPLGVGKLSGKGKYSIVCLYAKQFRALRKRFCACELDYIASLSRCKNWDAKGGKSGAGFVKTLDDRFVVKQIKKIELDSFLEFAPDYFNYINESVSSGSQTCLAKMLGIYQVTIRHARNGKDLKFDLMVMENLLFGRNITRVYDLKGAQHSRYISNADGMGKVYLDQNFVEDMNTSPLYIDGRSKRRLQRAIWNDTSFLTSVNVMDYSLLVGVDTKQHVLVCGIIDYLRQYTWDKHLETWVKVSLVVPKNVSPTVISPKEYKKRFRRFMSMHFWAVPDQQCPEISVTSLCEFCGDKSNSFELKNKQQIQ